MGGIIAVTLNGEEIVRADWMRGTRRTKTRMAVGTNSGLPLKISRGVDIFGIQDHGGQIWCRNIKVKPL